MPTILTLDVGNTNASLAFVSFGDACAPVAHDLGAWSRKDDEVSRLTAALERVPADVRAELGRAAISAVGASERERRLADALGSAGFEVSERPASGLHLAIESPETCGSDRQYAMRAALVLSREPGRAAEAPSARRVIVVDAGTAVTVDAGEIRSTEAGDELVFLGGAIALGPGSLVEAISARGARLPSFEPDVSAPALGRSTLGALRSGASVGFRGAVRELATSIAEEAFGSGGDAGPVDFGVFLTGGARDFARAPLAEIAEIAEGRLVEAPRLVHVGLALAAASVAEAGGGYLGQAGPG